MSFIDDMKNKAMGSIADENPMAGATLELLKNHPGVLNDEHIKAFAVKAGISPDVANAKIAELLPAIVDKLTLNGQVPEQSSLLQSGLNLLKSLVKPERTRHRFLFCEPC
jgi:uncharacterized protein YidB (DUF937 family)